MFPHYLNENDFSLVLRSREDQYRPIHSMLVFSVLNNIMFYLL